jgi:hypothetical protein
LIIISESVFRQGYFAFWIATGENSEEEIEVYGVKGHFAVGGAAWRG